jgi:predicted enzyme related to lactoylglutathione lyase
MLTTNALRGRFVWHELSTTNPAAAQDFYRNVIGWGTSKFDLSGHDYTMWLVGDAPIGGVMELPTEAQAMGARPNWLAYTEVPDVDRTIADAVELGAKVILPAHTAPDVGRFAILQDPQGALFAVITSATPPGDENDPQPREFSWHELVTTDPSAAIEFYDKLFGWESKGEFDMGDKGVYKMYGRDRFTYGGVMKKPDDMNWPSHWLHYVNVDSADDATSRATDAGATVMMPPMDVPGGGRIAILTDPQGAMFAVHSNATA